jgi:hypothetical protein
MRAFGRTGSRTMATSTTAVLLAATVGTGGCADDAHYRVVDHVDLSATSFHRSVVPVTFRGVLDGGGFTLSGLRIGTSSVPPHDVGFFAHVEGGTVRNLVFDAPRIDVPVSFVGVVVGRLEGGRVEDITVRDPLVVGGDVVGGVIGVAERSVAVVGVRVIGGAITGGRNVGGIVGDLFADVRDAGGDIDATFRSLESSATVNGSGSNVGGIAGRLQVNARLTLDSDNNCPSGAPHQAGILLVEDVHVRSSAQVVNTSGPTGGLVGRIDTQANCDGTSATTRILDSTVSADVRGAREGTRPIPASTRSSPGPAQRSPVLLPPRSAST